jgi:hypothetical protein
LLNKKLQIERHFDRDLNNSDTKPACFKAAMVTANTLGVSLPKTKDEMDRVQRWAVAILHPSTHFTEEIVRALLEVDLKGVGILVTTCTTGEGGNRVFRLLHSQPWVLPETEILIPVVRLSKEEHPEEAELCESVSRPQRACAARMRMPPVVEAAVLEKRKKNVRQATFWGTYNLNHFEYCTMDSGGQAGVGRALIVRQLAAADASAAGSSGRVFGASAATASASADADAGATASAGIAGAASGPVNAAAATGPEATTGAAVAAVASPAEYPKSAADSGLVDSSADHVAAEAAAVPTAEAVSAASDGVTCMDQCCTGGSAATASASASASATASASASADAGDTAVANAVLLKSLGDTSAAAKLYLEMFESCQIQPPGWVRLLLRRQTQTQ